MSKRIKWGKTHKETLEIFIKDFTDELKSEIKTSILNDEYFLRLNQTQFHYALNKKYDIPAIGSTTVKYWTHRGWSIEEAEQRRKKNKMGNKSPMRIEHWIEKGLTPEEADFKVKSQRKLNKEYWIARGYSDSESIKKVSEFQNENLKFAINKCQKSRKNNPERFSMKLEYWLAKGYSEQEAQEKLKERQTTFSKEKLIEKYCEVEGLKKWQERQDKWKAKVFNDKQWLGGGVSKISNDLFNKVLELANLDSKDCLFGIKNEKFISSKIDNLHYKYDFTYLPTKKIIEFHGDYWHCNPNLYKSDYYHKIKDMSAQQIWDYDKEKIELAKQNGYDVLVIWENDFMKNTKETVNKCLEFIKN